LALAALGCSYGITVRPADGPSLLSDLRASVVEADELSQRTRQTLRRWDLEPLYDRSPAEAYARLQAAAVHEPEPELLFALAEISYLLGRKIEKKECHAACAYYYLCAGYAYHYLFDDPARAGNAFDPRFRQACDLYNTGLAKCIRSAQRVGRLDPRQQLHLPTPDGKGFILSVVHHDFPWKPEEFGPLLFCADYDVVGLANHYRGYGLGVALIGTRVPDAPAGERAGGASGRPPALRYPREVSFPVTAFFRFEGTVADLGATRAGRLELFNPFAAQEVRVGGQAVPLEADLTTPLAYFLSRTDLEGVEYTGFLSADRVADRTGLYMFEPYQPGKIPVVMVHGLLSSPLTWTTLFNDLRADPALRERYQFWFYLYATGSPYVETAADLRQTLARLHRELDPDGRDAALGQMVVVGHSMGGLIARLLTEDSGDDFWRLVSSRPVDGLKVRPETKAELERVFYFERELCIRRVVFIATPHHGSALSPSPPARLAAQFIHLPKRLMQAAGDLAKADPQALGGLHEAQLSTSLDLLAPGAPALELLTSRPRPEGVHFHSVIGDLTGKGPDGSDGVVPYKSAHLDGVDSEVVVPAGHTSVHQHPRAVLEVKRILEEHARRLGGLDPVPVPPRLLPPPTDDQPSAGAVGR
jgi:pimeloyl-ACP methyl ester carboxylesterase